MKKFVFIIAATAAVFACSKNKDYVEPAVTEPITVTPPDGSDWDGTRGLAEEYQAYASGANKMALKFIQTAYRHDNKKSQVYSPLSLQFALSMAANGASGKTLQEIADVLGFGAEGISALNAYNNTLMKQLPALNPEVKLVMNNALVANSRYSLAGDFRQKVSGDYYAAVESMDFSDPGMVAARVNDWTRRCTGGFIDRIVTPYDINASTMTLLMNALYFKAPWADKSNPLFLEENTIDEDFFLSDGGKTKVPMMYTYSMRHMRYAKKDGYGILAIPYYRGSYFMYIFLPDDNNLEGMLDKLTASAWRPTYEGFSSNVNVTLYLPRFETEISTDLKDILKDMGVRTAFSSSADFRNMFTDGSNSAIDKVLQKNRIKVTEWGTEAASVTVVSHMASENLGDENKPKEITFRADHPFAYMIGELNTGTILFEGIFTGIN